MSNKKPTIDMEAPFDLGTVLDLLLLSIPRNTVLDQGAAMARTVGSVASTHVWHSLFAESLLNKNATSAFSVILAAYSSGTFGEKWRTRSEEKEGFARWSPGLTVQPRGASGGARFVVEKNVNGIITGGGGGAYHASDLMPPDTKCFLRGQKAFEKIQLDGFPLPQILVENIVVSSFIGLSGTVSPEDLGYLYRYVIVKDDGVDSVSCGNEIASWCQETIDKYVASGTVLAKLNDGGVKKITRTDRDGAFFSGARTKTLYRSMSSITFFNGVL